MLKIQLKEEQMGEQNKTNKNFQKKKIYKLNKLVLKM